MKKCINRRCNKQIEESYSFCPHCGKNQNPQPKKQKKRANGTGSIYVRKDLKSRPYAASMFYNGKRVYIGNYSTRTEAQKALMEYECNPVTKFNITFAQLHDEWKAVAYKKIGESMQRNYDTAWSKLQPIYNRKFRDLRTGEMQAIIDYYEAPHQKTGRDGRLKYVDKNGRDTYTVTGTPKMSEGLKFSALHKIKCLLTSMYTYAMQNDIVNKNYAEFVQLPKRNETSRSRFTDVQLEQLRQAIGTVPYADYIYCMCYLNFRVSEFLELTAESYHISDSGIPVFIGGKKTEAGTDRLVPIHPNIQGIVTECMARHGETVFCDDEGKAFPTDKFRLKCFYPAMKQLGFPDDLTPHSCRRTFSTRMSAAGARQEDIIALMGHTNFDVDINHYINQETETLYNAILKMG